MESKINPERYQQQIATLADRIQSTFIGDVIPQVDSSNEWLTVFTARVGTLAEVAINFVPDTPMQRAGNYPVSLPAIYLDLKRYDESFTTPYGILPASVVDVKGNHYDVYNEYWLNKGGEGIKVEALVKGDPEDFDNEAEEIPFKVAESIRTVPLSAGDFEYIEGFLQQYYLGAYKPAWVDPFDQLSIME